MSNTENTLRNKSQNTDGHWTGPVVSFVFVALLVSVPLLYFLKELFGSIFMFFATPLGYLWEIIGAKWVGFLFLGVALTGLCLVLKGSSSRKFAGGSLLGLLFLLVIVSIPGIPGSYISDALASRDEFSKLSPSEVQEMASVKNPTLTEKTVQSLVAGSWGVSGSKNACEYLQQQAFENPIFNERYVLFVNNQRSAPGALVKCKWFSLNRVRLAYNTRYAPNGLVAQLEAFEASRKK